MSQNRRNRRGDNFKDGNKRQIILAKKSPANCEKEEPPKILLKVKDPSANPQSRDKIEIKPNILKKEPQLQKDASVPPAAATTTTASYAHPEQAAALQWMMKPKPMINNQRLNAQIFDYISESNTEFLVVGAIGGQGVGKSTMLNLLASEDDFEEFVEIFGGRSGVFKARTGDHVFSSTAATDGLQMFITKDRIILIDTPPVLAGNTNRDVVHSEVEEIKQIIFLMSVCHVLLVVMDDYLNVNIVRLFHCAEMMKSAWKKKESEEQLPFVIFIKNGIPFDDYSEESEARTDNLLRKLFQQSELRIFAGNNACGAKKGHVNLITFPHVDVGFLGTQCGTHFYLNLIKQFRERVFMSSRHDIVSAKSRTCAITEKFWSNVLSSVWYSLAENPFLKNYESINERHNHGGHGVSGEGAQKGSSMYLAEM